MPDMAQRSKSTRSLSEDCPGSVRGLELDVVEITITGEGNSNRNVGPGSWGDNYAEIKA